MTTIHDKTDYEMAMISAASLIKADAEHVREQAAEIAAMCAIQGGLRAAKMAVVRTKMIEEVLLRTAQTLFDSAGEIPEEILQEAREHGLESYLSS